jgi:hypothetical protein
MNLMDVQVAVAKAGVAAGRYSPSVVPRDRKKQLSGMVHRLFFDRTDAAGNVNKSVKA